ncbi:hypothetical protein [Niallia sp. FSL W8-0635]|uniref:hypothetical protein n=1 Tax=Niallia sp. FSL W8-0635 TaxID=2975337 RepID=UPI0009C8D042|nr:Uncharacterised protein [Mycobacteroides abscessus subsp. abscessus]HEO8421522.1 hypothetical protein [Yersinia enterocolitica]
MKCYTGLREERLSSQKTINEEEKVTERGALNINQAKKGISIALSPEYIFITIKEPGAPFHKEDNLLSDFIMEFISVYRRNEKPSHVCSLSIGRKIELAHQLKDEG